MRFYIVVIAAIFMVGCASIPPRGSSARGMASWYGEKHHGRKTASGEIFDMNKLTAAHRSLPFGTRVRVRSLSTGKSVEVRINDRGPYAGGRAIDLSRAAAERLGIIAKGEDLVEFEILSRP